MSKTFGENRFPSLGTLNSKTVKVITTANIPSVSASILLLFIAIIIAKKANKHCYRKSLLAFVSCSRYYIINYNFKYLLLVDSKMSKMNFEL